MEKLKAFEFASPAAKPQYDWDTLLNGDIYKLKAGTDYKCSETTIRMMALANGRKRGVYVKTAKVDGGVVIQQVGPASEEDIAKWARQADKAKEAAKVRAEKKKAKATEEPEIPSVPVPVSGPEKVKEPRSKKKQLAEGQPSSTEKGA